MAPLIAIESTRTLPTNRVVVHDAKIMHVIEGAVEVETTDGVLADAGIALHVLQEILGQQSIETTKGYLHPDHRHLAEAARQANQFLSATPIRRDTARRDGPRL